MKKTLILPCVMTAILVILWFTRWDYGATKSFDTGVVKWKVDKWVNQGWVEVYSVQGYNEVPRQPGTETSADAWQKRNQLTNYWYGAVAITVFGLVLLWFGPSVLKRKKESKKQKAHFFGSPQQGQLYSSIDHATDEESGKSVPQIRPWIRYWAKMIDVFLVGVFGGILFFTSDPNIYAQPMFYVTALVSLVLIESILLSTWGTTPGKWLLRIYITDEDGHRLSFVNALKRNSIALLIGLGAGIPLIAFITLAYSYYHLNNLGKTYWDKQIGSMVSHKQIGLLRGITAAIFIIFIIGLSSMPME